MIPSPDKDLKQIITDAMSTKMDITLNWFWTEITTALLLGHFFGKQFGYIGLIKMGAGGLGLALFIEIIKELHKEG